MGLVRAGAWAAATAAAVSVSWFGVHSVLADDSAGQPQTLVVAVTVPATVPPPPPPTSIGTPAQTPSASPTPDAGPTAARTAHAQPSGPAAPAAPPASPSEAVQSFTRPGGLIVVAMGATSAHLVTATPDPGWSVHTWSQPTWLRVDFEKDDGTDSVFYVTWNGHPPTVQT
ncbi:hypothetical protein [Streptacidiphilus cavernicola]|uniref:Secreted protein n=1 Tax=Streptacidiphilus cavernicola TaxID=3342716 RepID=A0ABV6VZZ3_9ACTN